MKTGDENPLELPKAGPSAIRFHFSGQKMYEKFGSVEKGPNVE